jgi:hypothetical protein
MALPITGIEVKPWTPTELQKQLIFESITRGFNHWRNLWKEPRKTAEFEVEYPFWVVDPAKPDSDRSVVHISEIATWPADSNAPTDLLTPEAKTAIERIKTRSQQDHIWNMIVLAAESSRYNP